MVYKLVVISEDMIAYVFSSCAECFFVGDVRLHGFNPLYLFPENMVNMLKTSIASHMNF